MTLIITVTLDEFIKLTEMANRNNCLEVDKFLFRHGIDSLVVPIEGKDKKMQDRISFVTLTRGEINEIIKDRLL